VGVVRGPLVPGDEERERDRKRQCPRDVAPEGALVRRELGDREEVHRGPRGDEDGLRQERCDVQRKTHEKGLAGRSSRGLLEDDRRHERKARRRWVGLNLAEFAVGEGRNGAEREGPGGPCHAASAQRLHDGEGNGKHEEAPHDAARHEVRVARDSHHHAREPGVERWLHALDTVRVPSPVEARQEEVPRLVGEPVGARVRHRLAPIVVAGDEGRQRHRLVHEQDEEACRARGERGALDGDLRHGGGA
jgi:hypothetical protein